MVAKVAGQIGSRAEHDAVDRHAETDRVVAHGVGRRPVVVDAVGENVQHGAAGGGGGGEGARAGGTDRPAVVGTAPARVGGAWACRSVELGSVTEGNSGAHRVHRGGDALIEKKKP